jgi:large subunit ribosomal protein L21
MYAIVETGGKQYRVKPGDTLAVERLSGEPGETLDLDRVLLVAGHGKDEARVGSPGVAGAVVRAEVVEHIRGQKIIVFRYKSKVRYRRKTGHRQSLTRLRITDILLDGQSSLAAEDQRRPPAAAAPISRMEGGAASEEASARTMDAGAAAAQADMPPSAGEAGPVPEELPASTVDQPTGDSAETTPTADTAPEQTEA